MLDLHRLKHTILFYWFFVVSNLTTPARLFDNELPRHNSHQTYGSIDFYKRLGYQPHHPGRVNRQSRFKEHRYDSVIHEQVSLCFFVNKRFFQPCLSYIWFCFFHHDNFIVIYRVFLTRPVLNRQDSFFIFYMNRVKTLQM